MKSQLWMMLNGVMDAPLKEFSCVTISDWEGNTVCVPIVSSLTLIFSILSILSGGHQWSSKLLFSKDSI